MADSNQEISDEKIEKDWEIDAIHHSARHKSGLVFHYLQTRQDGTIELATENLNKWKQEQTCTGNEQETELRYQELKKEFSFIIKKFPPAEKIKPSDFFKAVREKYHPATK